MNKIQARYLNSFNLSEIDNAGVDKVINDCLAPKIAISI